MDEKDDGGDVVEYQRYAARLNSCEKDSYVQFNLHHSKSGLSGLAFVKLRSLVQHRPK